jgi:hypothetical protein
MNLETVHVGGPTHDLAEIPDPFQLFHFELTRTVIQEEATVAPLTSVVREVADTSRVRGPFAKS